MDTLEPTSRTRLRRLPARGHHDLGTINAILDEGLVCHLAFVADGQPFAIPTGYARDGREVYVHGSAASRMLRTMEGGLDVCLTVTLLDGVVLARSAVRHSFNYRSVVLLGQARPVTETDAKLHALRCFTNHVIRGRWEEVRPPNAQELKATTVLALPIDEASAKVRSGPPVDDPADLELPVWAGVVPVRTVAHCPVAVDGLRPEIAPFDVERLRRATARA